MYIQFFILWFFVPCAYVFSVKTRAVRGSDYSPATALSEEKDKLVTENWNDREKNIQGLYQNHMHIFIPCRKHLQNFKTISAKL